MVNIKQGNDVFSAGQENIATLRQISIGVTAINLRNDMNVTQEGASNRINSDQYGQNNRLKATQTVFTNSSKIITSQSGWNNGIVVLQDGNPAGGTAQFTATITQGALIPANAYSGANGNVTALPNTHFNSVLLDQIGGGSGVAILTQSGSSGLIKATQRGGDISQNQLTVTQSNNAGADVRQAGNANEITIDQQGYQYAKVRQESTDPAIQTEPVNSIVDIAQGVNQLDDTRNSADVSQTTGDGNQAYVRQNTAGAERNYATIRQSGTRLGATPSVVIIRQEGKSSTVEVEQMVNSSGNNATFDQNTSELFKGSNAKLKQGGNNNTFTSTQEGNTNSIGGTIGDKASFAMQVGIDNVANIDQEGYNNDVAFMQGGDEDHDLDVSQEGKNNQATISQLGDNNEIDIDQENEESGLGNKAFATQGATSSDGDITIHQDWDDGGGNTATVTQTEGDGNSAHVDQYMKNTATVRQSGTEDAGSGTDSDVDIDQSLSENGTATATQDAGTFGGDIEILQEKDGNTATVAQTKGRLNQAEVTQTDDGNTAKVTQSGTVDAGIASTVRIQQDGMDGEAK